MRKNILMVCALLLWWGADLSAKTDFITVKDGQISYKTDAKGNRLLDYSYCGYMASEKQIPDLDNVVLVEAKEGDNSQRIQKAIDYVSAQKPDKLTGYRGAVILGQGNFRIDAALRISASGVVLRGMDKKKTVLTKSGADRGAMIYVEGNASLSVKDTMMVAQEYVPVNAMTFTLDDASSLKAGDRIKIVRVSTKEWIESLGCDIFGGGISALGWKPGDVDICWSRVVKAVDGNNVTIDAPLSMPLEKASATYVFSYTETGGVENCGVENISLVSDYDRNYPKGEDHCWNGVYMDNAENCWVRNVDFSNLAGSAVILQPETKYITVEDCRALNPVSEIGGLRRQVFQTYGELTLFQRCYSQKGINDFSAGYAAAGPNAFVQCESFESLGFSGAVGSWACGLLFDIVNIDGHNLTFKNLGQDKNGAGWNSANSTFWQCSAAEVECYSPCQEQKNLAFGVWAQFSGNGEWDESNNHVSPRSLFYYQLSQRLATDSIAQARILPVNTNASSSPTVEAAAEMARQALLPKHTLEMWIDERRLDNNALPKKIVRVDDIKDRKEQESVKPEIHITDGRLLAGNSYLAGAKHDIQWWSGKTKPNYLPKMRSHITRFVPGREGLGLTDRIDSVVAQMQKDNVLIIDHNYGLWYDRRRDDHERIRRRDGDVWAPFYQQPFARSGEGSAWEGLSKYDLERFDLWYWSRLKEFADKAEVAGKLLFHENYFQHNILEAGAHWVDCPWRTANNINNTGFLEPVNFAGDKRVFVADTFYDVTDPVRRALHKKYIRQCLDNFSDNRNVIQLISAEYTGPLHFVQFWIDEISAWEKETGKKTLVALSATKDVQDAILEDPVRSSVVDIIDIRYWNYKNDGGIYSPEGGKNMAPRQHMRKIKVGKVTFNEAYRMVDEYRSRYPQKAVTYFGNNYPDMCWAVLMAEGSCPVLPFTDRALLNDIANMHKQETNDVNYRKIGKIGTGFIIYSQSESNYTIPVEDGKYDIYTINAKTGEITPVKLKAKLKDSYQIEPSESKNSIYWFKQL